MSGWAWPTLQRQRNAINLSVHLSRIASRRANGAHDEDEFQVGFVLRDAARHKRLAADTSRVLLSRAGFICNQSVGLLANCAKQ